MGFILVKFTRKADQNYVNNILMRILLIVHSRRVKMCEFVNNTKHCRIDKCMKVYVDFINKTSLAKTLYCCCGHGKYKRTMIVKLNLKGNPIMEIFSGIYLPKRRNYYKKDKQGRYFIPEVQNGA